MRSRLYISPTNIRPYGKDDKRTSYLRPEDVSNNHNWATLLPNFAEVYQAGANTLAVINAEIMPFKVVNMEKITIFLQFKKHFGIIKPITEALLPEKLVWVLCNRTEEARDLITRTRYSKPTILTAPDCSGEFLSEMIRAFHHEAVRAPDVIPEMSVSHR